MRNYEKALNEMEKLFGRDYQFALATSNNLEPTVRYIDTYYKDGYFYVVTYGKSRKVQDIKVNSKVSLTCRKLYSFQGVAENIGHPLLKKNKEIREELIKVFEKWYFKHNNEDDENMCYLRIKPTNGFFYSMGTGYKVDFEKETADFFDFNLDIGYTEE